MNELSDLGENLTDSKISVSIFNDLSSKTAPKTRKFISLGNVYVPALIAEVERLTAENDQFNSLAGKMNVMDLVAANHEVHSRLRHLEADNHAKVHQISTLVAENKHHMDAWGAETKRNTELCKEIYDEKENFAKLISQELTENAELKNALELAESTLDRIYRTSGEFADGCIEEYRKTRKDRPVDSKPAKPLSLSALRELVAGTKVFVVSKHVVETHTKNSTDFKDGDFLAVGDYDIKEIAYLRDPSPINK